MSCAVLPQYELHDRINVMNILKKVLNTPCRDHRIPPHCANLKYLLQTATNALILLFLRQSTFSIFNKFAKTDFRAPISIIESRIILLASKYFVLNEIGKLNVVKQAPWNYSLGCVAPPTGEERKQPRS